MLGVLLVKVEVINMTIREALARIGSHMTGTFLHKHAMNVILRAYRPIHFKRYNKKDWDSLIKSLDEDDDIYEDARLWAIKQVDDKFGKPKLREFKI